MLEKIKSYKKLIINKLVEISKIWDEKDELKNAICYSLLNYGKLARSVIVLLGLENLNINYNEGLDVACAIEMIQTYSLIHDDLPEMDNATIRRGKLCNHLKYGHARALLAGDALLTDAFLIISNTPLESVIKNKLVRLFAEKAGSQGICYGQSLDIDNITKNELQLSEIQKIISLKTCSLFELAFISIGILAKLDSSKIDILKLIGYEFGFAFQIKDDLNDEFESKDNLGKDVGQDINKCTYHQICGVDVAKLKIDQLMKSIDEKCQIVFGLNNTVYKYLKLLMK